MTSLAYGETKGSAHCGGLFLLDNNTAELSASQCSATDTVQFGAHRVYAEIGYDHINGKWKDGWTLSLKRDALFGSAGFISDFKYISLSVTANSSPAITSRLTAHTADSSFYMGTILGSGNPVLATIRWESQNENDEVHEIEANWESDYLRKGFVIGRLKKSYQFQASLDMFQSTPVKPHEEYFIKDSSLMNIWNFDYRYNFSNTELDLHYMMSSAHSTIIGNSYRDNSTKRFMYLPVRAHMQYANAHWGNETYGLDAKGITAFGRMESDGRRFYETLAPNRLLPVSVTQALSFSFLQMNYLIDASLDIGAATFGGYFNPHFNISSRTSIVPKFGLYGYYTYDELYISRISETTSFIGYNSETEWWNWTLESTGLIANLGLSFGRMSPDKSRILSLEWDATQIVPLKTDIRKKWESESSEEPSKTKPEGTSPSGIFKNGFASGIAIRYQF